MHTPHGYRTTPHRARGSRHRAGIPRLPG
ncbi:MAG: succinylglutamate desuccinylase [Chitinophagia bacterium]|nr:succinylglutamate desuccinylase [Chitinophagia bacterium]